MVNHWAHGVVATLIQRRDNVVCPLGSLCVVERHACYVRLYSNCRKLSIVISLDILQAVIFAT